MTTNAADTLTGLEKTREQSIADFIERTKGIQEEHPEVDFTTAVIEPTMNLTYDIRVSPKEYNHSLGLM